MNDTTEVVELEGSMVAESGMVALLNKSEIDQQIATAHKYPRSIKRFRDQALQLVTLTEDIARECIYAIPRDGKTIEGPSARFAEVIASSWHNCRAGARVVSDTGDFITAQGVFHDLENNVAITYEVQRRITTSKGKRYGADMIGVTGNAASSIALRNAILKGVPKALWSSLYQAARKTVMGDFETLANRRANAVQQFLAFGVTKEMICAVLSVPGVEDIGLEQLVTLSGLLTAIKDGDTTVEQAFAGSTEKAVQQPQSKTREPEPKAAATQMPETARSGESGTNPPSTASAPAAATNGNGETIEAKPLTKGQVGVILAKMENAALSMGDFQKRFGCMCAEGAKVSANRILAWIGDPANV